MIDLSARAAIILAVAWCGSRVLSRAAAATRYHLWQCALIATLLAPATAQLLPRLDVPLAARISTAIPGPLVHRDQQPPLGLDTSALQTDDARTTNRAGRSFSDTLTAIWVAGSTVVGAWFVLAYAAILVRRRQARRPSVTLETTAARVATTHGFGRPIDLIICNGAPYTAGIFRAHIALPPDAETWPSDRLRVVLLHELAHVRRRDCLSQVVAQIACTLHWFNPMVWVAMRALRRERERSCDDQVLSLGVTPSTYAQSLLDISCHFRRARHSPSVLAMARRSELEARLLSVLDTATTRVTSRPVKFIVTGLVASAAVLCSATQFVESAPLPRSRPDQISGVNAEDPERAVLQLALESTPEVIPMLIAALGDADPQVREKAALGLAWRHDPRVIDPLLARLQDSDNQVREKVVIALGSTGDQRALNALRDLLRDPDEQVREKAGAALMLARMNIAPDQSQRARDNLRGLVNGLLALAQ